MIRHRSSISCPSTLAEAIALLAKLGLTRNLAGGQSLIPLMKLRMAAPKHLIDLMDRRALDIRESDDI